MTGALPPSQPLAPRTGRLDPLTEYDVAIADPDSDLARLFHEFGDEIAAAVRLAAAKRGLPMTTADLFGCVQRAGVGRFAALVRSTARATRSFPSTIDSRAG